jgi:hypothetical protein
MTPRERLMAVVLTGLILLGGGAALGYFLVLSPLDDKEAAAMRMQTEIDGVQAKLSALARDRARIVAVKRQSLPPDLNQAKAQYKELLERLLQLVRLTDYRIGDAKVLGNPAPVTPELKAKTPAYTRLAFEVDVNKATIWQIADFLEDFYDVDLLHQITHIKIKRDNKPTEARNGLDMHLTIEAIILDGAEDRRTLLPVTTAVAAVGGIPAIEAVGLTPELGRKMLTASSTNVLASRNRNYAYLARRDPFYGKLDDIIPPPFTVRPPENVTLGRDGKPVDAKLQVTGEGALGAKIETKVSGSLFPAGTVLKVDPKTFAVTLPGVGTADTPDNATATVSVVATSADGKKKETSFNVYIARTKSESETPAGPDIAAAIRLIGRSGNSDGSEQATIFDAANPYLFKITVTGKKFEVLRFWQAKAWKKDLDYEQKPGVLAFADNFSSTKRTFTVVAFESEAVILCELGEPETKAETGKGGGRFPGGGGVGRVRQGHAEPLAVVAGNPAAAIPKPVFYRWELGKSLAELTKLKSDEIKVIQQRVAADGPLVTTAVSTGN